MKKLYCPTAPMTGMELPPFELERWFDEYEPDADLMLAESGVRSLPADRFDLDVGELGYVIPTDGEPAFRAEIAERYGRDTEEIVLTCGTQEADFLTFASFLDEGDHSVVVSPTYQSLASVPGAIGEVSEIRTEPPEWDLPVEAVAEAMRPETRLVVLTNPSNPTGKYLGPETMRALYDLVEEHDACLLVDEVYRMLAEDPHAPAAALGPRAISTAGVSKSYGLAGARLGWVVASPEIADAVRKWKDYTTISPPMRSRLAKRWNSTSSTDSVTCMCSRSPPVSRIWSSLRWMRRVVSPSTRSPGSRTYERCQRSSTFSGTTVTRSRPSSPYPRLVIRIRPTPGPSGKCPAIGRAVPVSGRAVPHPSGPSRTTPRPHNPTATTSA